jgi:hypothetical protein
MIVIAGKWIESEFITVDENGIHCADNAPDEIKKQYFEYMSTVNNSGAKLIEPEDD